ncbi:hypothetical protein B0H34DRAFT_807718 [Crassisporium funariophilum]|nr:hypothetical protein B0H34DRAFT_807718 [Crassisporium funariophilum]
MSPTLISRVYEEDLGKAAPTLLNLWIYSNLIVNTILLPLLVATFLFSGRVKRHPILVNLCVTWIFSGIFSLLLFYVKQHVGPEPNKSLCIAQTSLLYGITPMWSVAVLMLLCHMAIILRGADGGMGFYKLTFMLSAPYIVQCAFSIAALFISLNNPDRVTRAHCFFYCALDYPPLSWTMSSFTVVVCVVSFVVEIYLGILTYRNWRGFRKAGGNGGTDFQVLLRVLVFGVYIFVGMIVTLISMFAPHSVAPDITAATAGTVVFLVFGTQTDVFQAWFFWLPTPFKRSMRTRININPAWTWRQSEFDLTKSIPPDKAAEGFENLPPIPPPKSKEYLRTLRQQVSVIELPIPPWHR